ncbi:MAG: DUF177 domain-containing protein [Acidobacteriota bacterium]|nr:DUF177 domain-containing protein [Acidobacteriota bacterium]
MRVDLASLEGGKGSFAHTYEPGKLVLEDERLRLVSPVTVSGKIRREDGRVKVKGRVEAGIQAECDRCLKPVELTVNSKFKLDYVSTHDYEAQQAVELSEEDLDLAVFDGEAIDIDALVTEELLLAVPDHLLCKDDCKGICPQCGIDRNSAECGCNNAEVDPRWSGLKELINRE